MRARRSPERTQALSRWATCCRKIVAGLVPQRVVDELESIQVHKDDGGSRTVQVGSGDASGQALGEQQAIRQAGEVVMHGPMHHLSFGLLASADVAGDDGRTRELATGFADGRDAQ